MADAPKTVFDNDDFVQWSTAFKAYLDARKSAEAGVGVAATAGASIHAVDAELAKQKWDYFNELAQGLYGAPKTEILEKLIYDERKKASKASQADIMKWTQQLNVLEAFRKYLAAKRSEKLVYVRASQAAAAHATRVSEYMRLVMDLQPAEVGGGKPK